MKMMLGKLLRKTIRNNIWEIQYLGWNGADFVYYAIDAVYIKSLDGSNIREELIKSLHLKREDNILLKEVGKDIEIVDTDTNLTLFKLARSRK